MSVRVPVPRAWSPVKTWDKETAWIIEACPPEKQIMEASQKKQPGGTSLCFLPCDKTRAFRKDEGSHKAHNTKMFKSFHCCCDGIFPVLELLFRTIGDASGGGHMPPLTLPSPLCLRMLASSGPATKAAASVCGSSPALPAPPPASADTHQLWPHHLHHW